jgi:hypothetical protein
MDEKEHWLERLPWPISLPLILLYILGMAIGVIILIVAFGALMYFFWSGFSGS